MRVAALIPSTAALAREGDRLLIVNGISPYLMRIARIREVSLEGAQFLRFTLDGGDELDFAPSQPVIFQGYWST